MSELFLTVLNMSLTAGWLIGVVLILRLLLKKAPKWASVLLWGIAALRLILPFSMESAVSLVPETQWVERQPSEIPEIPDEILLTPDVITDTEFGENITVIQQDNTVQLEIHEKPDLIGIFSYIWLGGGALMLLYAAVSAVRLRLRVASAVLLRDNIYQSEHIPTPFVLGIIQPRIYVPFSLDESALPHVIAHENAHIRRWDHIWKPLGFLILAVHWFNPLVWVGYILLCRDIEAACDEKVVGSLDDIDRADYSQALLTCSTGRRLISACPLAFGEVSVKERVKNVLSYKKPALWILLSAVIVCAVFAVCFLTDPAAPDEAEWKPLDTLIENYTAEEAAKDGCVVIDALNLLSGEEIWNEFISKINANKPAAVRIYESYSGELENYLLEELRYDGSVFRLTHYDWTEDTNELFLNESEYQYMVHSTWDNQGRLYDTYLLADSTEVTAEGYWNSTVSSVHRPEYDIYNHCRLIYSVFTGESETPYQEYYVIPTPYFTKNNVRSELTFAAPDAILEFVARMGNDLNMSISHHSASEQDLISKVVLTELEVIPIQTTPLTESAELYRIGFKLIATAENGDEIYCFTEQDMECPYLLVYEASDNTMEGHKFILIDDRELSEAYNTEEMLERYGDMYTAAAMEKLRQTYPKLFPENDSQS